MKRISLLIVTFLLFSVFYGQSVQGDVGVKLYINEESIDLYPAPKIENGSVKVPVRSYFEGFGAVVSYDYTSRGVVVQRGERILRLCDLDGISFQGGMAYGPLRAMAGFFGDEIIYESQDRSIRIKSEYGWIQKKLPQIKGTVAITFDDGPGGYTGRIVDILKKHGAGATFFVLGCNIPGNEATIKKIADAGFEIGNHTYGHPNLLKLGTEDVKRQIERTQILIHDITGKRPIYFRPPYGAFSKSLAGSVDMAMVLWSVDPADWKYNSSDPIVSNILNNVRDGSIIILHDTEYITAVSLERILTGLKNKGYSVVSVSDMLKAHNIEPEKNMIYFCSYDIR